jgi:Zn-dependent protease
MFKGFKLGKIFGIEIDISYSWFFIFALVTFLLTFTVFPLEFPHHSLPVNIILGLFTSAVFFACLLFHELSHSLVANLNGMPIRKITLFVFGGMAQMSEEPKNPLSEFKMAIAGPASSVLLSAFFYLLYRLFLYVGLSSSFYASFIWLWQINFLLAAFNLAPGFPLDGGRILRSVLWYFMKDMEKATNIASKAGQGVALLLMAIGFYYFIRLNNLGGIWFILIGWFLYQSAASSYQQLLLQHSLSGVKVDEIMSKEVETVGAEITIKELADNYFTKYQHGRFPVVDNKNLIGVVAVHDADKIPQEKWGEVKVEEVMKRLDEQLLVRPKDDVVRALTKMANSGANRLLVVDENELAGVIARTDIMRLIKLKSRLVSQDG